MTESVVIVEDRAHLSLGHFPNEFAKLADGFAELNLDVDVLTRAGWALEGSSPRAWNLHTVGPRSEQLLRVARRAMGRFGQLVGNAYEHITVKAYFGLLLRTAVLIVSARRLARSRSQSGERALIVVVAMDFMPALLSILGGADRWVIWQFSPKVPFSRSARAIERVRHAIGRPDHHFVLAAHDDRWIEALAEQVSSRHVASIPLVASRRVEIDRAGSRASLGLDDREKVAVLFAAGHRGQEPQTVMDAFRHRPDWQLVIGGGVCARLDHADLSTWPKPPVMFEGFVEDSVREMLFGIADVAVLSFVSTYVLRSGTVMDAASHRLPILVSSGSLAADLVEQTGAGEVFEAESPTSLLDALDRIDLRRAGEGSERLREMCSTAVVCRAHLDALA